MSPIYSKVSVQEDMLPGPSLEDRFAQAADLGIEGLEVWSETLPGQVSEIVRLNGRAGVVVSSVNHGRRSRFLDPDPIERRSAMSELSEAIRLAGHIGAVGVGYAPHFFGPLLPDLSPYRTARELELGLLSAQLDELADQAQAAGVQLWVEPINRYETHLLVHLEQAASLVMAVDKPHLGIVADLFHMALDEADVLVALRDSAALIGQVHLADNNRRLPGQGSTDFKPVLNLLREIGYDGWMTFECGEPGDNHPQAQAYLRDLPSSLAYMFDPR